MELTAFERVTLMNIIEKLCEANVKEVANRNIHVNDWLEEHAYDACLDVDVDSGCTKAVFFSCQVPNYVIKVPTTGHTNYCALEAKAYEKAKEEGYKSYFAACEFFTEMDGIPFYIQERVNCDENYFSDLFFEYAEGLVSRGNYDNDDDYSDAVSDRAEYMDDWEVIEAVFADHQFSNFIFDTLQINDFHRGNFGIRSNGDLVLVDYSGY